MCLVLAASNLMLLASLSARPTAAATAVTSDLLGIAFNFSNAGEDSIVFLTNTNPGSSIRAVLTAWDRSGALAGCGARTLKPGEQGVLYVLTSAKDWVENILSVKVYGLAASSKPGKLQPIEGLAGQIAQVEQATGATKSLVGMIAVASSSDDRQSELDQCLATGPLSVLGDDNIVSTQPPNKWSKV
jgi:hypothetical protein